MSTRGTPFAVYFNLTTVARKGDPVMRFLCFLFLLVFLGVVGAFAYFNQIDITLQFFDRSVTAPMAAVVGAAYVLGMLSGWTIVGMVRRSIHYVTERPIVGERIVSR